MRFPQTRSDDRVVYSAGACKARGFDYCLELRGTSRGVKRYYSKRGWEVSGGLTAARAEAQLIISTPPP